MNTNTFKSETLRPGVGFEFNAPRVTGCANSKLKSQAGRAVAFRAALKEYKSSARAKARARTNVAQSMGPQPLRFRSTVSTRKVSVALRCGLPLELGVQPFPALTVSSPGELHPQALPEPDVNLSIHPAPIVQSS